MKQYLYSPAIEDQSDFIRQAVRVAWYFDHLKQCCFTIPSPHSLADVAVEKFIDSTTPKRLKEMIAAGRIIVNDSADHDNVAGIIAWRGIEEAVNSLPVELKQKVDAGKVEVYNVDTNHRMEGSLYIDVGNKILATRHDYALHQRRLANLKTATESDKVFLFCTGPSVEEYKHYDFTSGTSIVCNSVILDDDLMRQVKPQILVFADPIFHFGCSSYAEEFRTKLRSSCAEFDLQLLIPDKYLSLFCASLPDLADRIIALPYQKDIPIQLDLIDNFRLHTTDNILTFLMLPIAATIGKQIYLLGCDGRKLEDDAYFWSHNQKTQINSEMDNIQRAHPSFFKLDYNEYYLRHCKTLESYCTAIEAAGKRVYNLAHSHIDALTSREYPFKKYRGIAPYISINPDLQDRFGHYFHYDARVAEALPKDTRLISLCHEDADLNGDLFESVPTFSKNSFHIRSKEGVIAKQEFAKIIDERHEQLALLPGAKNIYMYTGALDHAEAYVDLLRRKPQLFTNTWVHINLFYLHFDYDPITQRLEHQQRYQALCRTVYRSSPNAIRLYVDSERMRQTAERLHIPGLINWPMIGVSSPSTLASIKPAQKNGKQRIFCPATGQISKGFDTACQAALQVLQGPDAESYEFIFRDLIRDVDKDAKNLQQVLASLRKHPQVRLLSGVVSDEDYLAEYAAADAILLPYTKQHFYSRTSGALVDALFYGKPIICVADTWLADEAGKLGLTKSFTESDPNSCAQAITRANPTTPKSPQKHWQTRYQAKNLVELWQTTTASEPLPLLPEPLDDRRSMLEMHHDLITLWQQQRAESHRTQNHMENLNSALQTISSEFQSQISAVASSLQSLSKNLEEIQAQSESLRLVLEQLQSGRMYEKFNRFLNEHTIEHILNKWCPLLSVELRAEQISYFAHRICTLEDQCVGQLATSIENAVLRLITCIASSKDNFDYLEIGTLFGINMCCMFDLIRGTSNTIHLTSIDPLDGYYQQERDILTGYPVSEKILKSNLHSVGMDPDQYTLINELSESEEAIKQAGQRSYDLILVDGDHSCEGVKRDVENYTPMLRSGGYLIINDYRGKDWPEITTYVNTEVSDIKSLSFVGADFRSALFQKS